jgi:hypothetical protein
MDEREPRQNLMRMLTMMGNRQPWESLNYQEFLICCQWLRNLGLIILVNLKNSRRLLLVVPDHIFVSFCG